MNFSIKQLGVKGERIGILTDFAKLPKSSIETPAAAVFTQGASVVHLTAEVLEQVFSNTQLLWIPLSNSLKLEIGVKAQGEGIAKFAGLPGHATALTLHNMSEVTQPGGFEQNKVPLWTKNGKKIITAHRYMDLVEIFKPDIVLAIADGHNSISEGYKRIGKSVERTCNMFDVCVERFKQSTQLKNTALIGVVVGPGNDKKCKSCIEHILKNKESLTGVALAGLIDGTDKSMKDASEAFPKVLEEINALLPKDLLRIVEGCWNPVLVLCAIEQGWDIFDGSYPLKLTNAGKALTLNFDVQEYRHSGEMCILDFNDRRYKDEFKPVLEGCECLACRKHTRAYIQHLINTREMLASVLLAIHNLHHFDQMFVHARRHIASNTFQLYKDHITKQYDYYKASVPEEQAVENETKETKKVKLGDTVEVEKVLKSDI